MTDIQPFTYKDHAVRVVTVDGEPWFVLADLCKVLNLAKPSRVAMRIADDMKGAHLMSTLGGDQEMTTVSEAGMYEVIIRSDKPEAAAFRRWITSEVLPSIRKHGGYLTDEKIEDILTDPDTIIQLATQLKAERSQRLDEDEKSKFNLGLPGGDARCVNDAGLYSLALAARKQSTAGPVLPMPLPKVGVCV